MVVAAPLRAVSRRLTLAFVLLALALVAAFPGGQPPSAPSAALSSSALHGPSQSAQPVAVIVRTAGSLEILGDTVRALGGEVRATLRLVDGLAVTMPGNNLAALARTPGVFGISHDAPLVDTQLPPALINTSLLKMAYARAIGAEDLWNTPLLLSGDDQRALSADYLRGDGVGIAVVDSGINPQEDLYTLMGQNRLVAAVAFHPGDTHVITDHYGHGNHVAGIIGGNGRRSGARYMGVAPNANLISVKVLDDSGAGTTTSLIQGLEWIYNNHQAYNIRVVNISVNSGAPESYHTSPISAAVEALWFQGIVVVVSAGNQGQGALYPPANDPFVITVGATDDRGTRGTLDDKIAGYSAFGRTSDGFLKPDLVAPGTNIVSLMANANSALATAYPTHVLDGSYFRMSGTSMAAPMVSGAIALLLQSEPQLTPDQVKFRLLATARPFSTRARAGAGHLDIRAAVLNRVNGSANQNVPVSELLAAGDPGLRWSASIGGTVNWRGKGTAFFSSVSWRGKTEGTSASVYWGN